MKVAIICGAPPNLHDAVGDFAWFLAQELGRAHAVSLIVPGCDRTVENGDPGRVSICRVGKGWGIPPSRELVRLVKRLEPHVVLVNYVPQLYGWNGAKPFLALLLLQLKRTGRRVITIAHEFAAPFGPSPRDILRASIHRVLLRLIVRSSSRIVTTTPFCQELLQRRFHHRRTDVRRIPISSTIPVTPADETRKNDLRRQVGLDGGELVVSTLGSAIEASALPLEKLLRWLTSEDQPVRFLVLGKAGGAVRERFARESAIADRLILTGPVSRIALSEHLALSHLYAAFYPDGASSRRTSLMAGLAHGIPTVSNLGPLTDPSLASSGALYLLDGTMKEADEKALRKLCRHPELREELGTRGRAFFEENFSWQRVGQEYARLVQEAATK